MLVFSLDDHRYALPADVARELIRAVAVVPLPGAPGVVEGVIDVRGEVVPVVNLRRRLGLPPREPRASDRLLLVELGSSLVALRLEATPLLQPVEPGTRGELPVVTHSALRGVGRLPDGLVLIHDVEAFLDLDERDALAAALDPER